jgi:hypothetical protein
MPFKIPQMRCCIGLLVASVAANPAAAQIVLIPHGGSDNDWFTYLVAFVSFVLLCFAMWRFFRGRR